MFLPFVVVVVVVFFVVVVRERFCLLCLIEFVGCPTPSLLLLERRRVSTLSLCFNHVVVYQRCRCFLSLLSVCCVSTLSLFNVIVAGVGEDVSGVDVGGGWWQFVLVIEQRLVLRKPAGSDLCDTQFSRHSLFCRK